MKSKHKKSNYFLDKGIFANLNSFMELENRISNLPEKERGAAFEVFAEAYLKTQSFTQAQNVWPDNDIPQKIRHKLGLPPADMGIDGVFNTHNDEYHAYQVKYRTNRLSLSWDELSTFMGLSDKSDKRVLFTNSNDISSVMDVRANFYSIKGNDLDKLDLVDFRAIETWLASGKVSREKKSPRPHQIEAINNILEELNKKNRVTAVMACATGKTLVALWVAEKKESKTILVLLPSLALVRQTLHDWAKENSWDKFNYLCVCSDLTVTNSEDGIILNQHELDFSVTTQKEDIEIYLKNQIVLPKIIFSTYQSCQIVAQAMPHEFSFDLAIFDEAHKTASREDSNYAFALQDKNLSIKKRLFLTATPRHYDINQKDKEGEQRLVYSMDDEEAYGKIAYKLSFRKAVQLDLICDYKIIISIIDSAMIDRELIKQGEVVVKGDVIKAQRIANILAIQNAVEKYEIKKIFSFHNSVASAKSFTTNTNEGIGAYLEDFTTFHINGEMPTGKRSNLLKEFEQSSKSIISNARCLTEGVNVPAVDMVAFVSPKKSQIDIVQAAGRAMRKADNKKFGYIFIPLFMQIAEDESIEEAIDKTKFDTVWDVLQAMQEQDESLVEIISQMREELGKTLGYNDNRLRERIEILGPQVYISELRRIITSRIIDKLGLTWDERFGELLKFKELNSHCNVPLRYPENPALGKWISAQRVKYKKKSISQDQIDKLEAIDFCWDLFDEYWEIMFAELNKFKESNSYCNVPLRYPENPALGLWVCAQRKRYKKKIISQDQIDKLEAIDFCWDPFDENWQAMFAELNKFKEANSHCNVPRGYPDNPSLGLWVSAQRQKYKKKSISQDQIDKLEAIDFCWNPLDKN